MLQKKNFDFFQCGGQEAAASRLAKAYKELETGPISTHLSGHTEPLDFMHRYKIRCDIRHQLEIEQVKLSLFY